MRTESTMHYNLRKLFGFLNQTSMMYLKMFEALALMAEAGNEEAIKKLFHRLSINNCAYEDTIRTATGESLPEACQLIHKICKEREAA